MKIWLYFPLSVFEWAFFSPNTGELCYKYLKRNIVLMPFSAKPFYNSKKKSRSVQTFQNICTRFLTKKCKTIWKQDYRDGNLTRWNSPERYEKILYFGYKNTNCEWIGLLCRLHTWSQGPMWEDGEPDLNPLGTIVADTLWIIHSVKHS